MDFVVGVEGRHVHLGAEAESGHQFIIIVIEDYVADFVHGFLIAASLHGSEVVERGWVALDAVTGSEVDGQDHGHLQSVGEVVGKVVFHCLPEVLQHY